MVKSVSYELLRECRLCHGAALAPVLDLGTQPLSGVFPKSLAECALLTRGPLALVRCAQCELVQLSVTYNLTAMYGSNYGYRSGLNRGMVAHLESVVRQIQAGRGVGTWVDIGSNDGTLLGFVPESVERIGFDPTICKFGHYYQEGIVKVPEFFSANRFYAHSGGADVVTSVACFYDLPDPVAFAKDIADILNPDGVWFSEQSYVGSMVQRLAYDTVCHEHLEYYGLKQVRRILREAGLRCIDFGFNDVNGGSFWFVAGAAPGEDALAAAAEMESIYLDEPVWEKFRERVYRHGERTHEYLDTLHDQGYNVYALGASTKGNVLLNHCSLGPQLVQKVAEVNPDKFGCFTPNGIPIVSEAEALADKPDYYLVLPWHFRDGFRRRQAEGAYGKAQLIYPLPELVTE